MRRAFLCLVLIACAVALGASSAAAAPADLDRSFGGGDGIAEVTGLTGSLPGEAGGRMAIGPNDDIFVLYSSYPPCDPPFECQVELSVARFLPDGSRDPRFSTGPQLVVRQSAFSHLFDLAVGPDRKPVIATYGGPGGGLVLARLGFDGRLDPSFGVGGVVPFTSSHSVEVANDFPKLAVQPDGRIVVAVQGGREESGRNLAVARFLANGEYDPSFGSGGEIEVLVGTQTRPAGLFVGANGNVTVPVPLCCLGGSGIGLFGEGLSVVRLTAAGQLDPDWAGDGTLFMPTPGSESAVEAATLAGDSLLLSTENSTPTVSVPGNLLKLAPNGALDPSFGNGGALRLFNRVGAISASDLTVDGKGRIVGVGWDSRIAVFRLRGDGKKDRTFNGGERLVLPYGGGGTPHYMVGIQSNGRIIAFGDSGLGAAKRFGLIALRGGTDRSRCLGKKATIVGTRGPDELAGTPRRDVIAALGGKDIVRGFAGKDLICGGKGRDQLFGGPGRDRTDEEPRRRRGRSGKPVR